MRGSRRESVSSLCAASAVAGERGRRGCRCPAGHRDLQSMAVLRRPREPQKRQPSPDRGPRAPPAWRARPRSGRPGCGRGRPRSVAAAPRTSAPGRRRAQPRPRLPPERWKNPNRPRTTSGPSLGACARSDEGRCLGRRLRDGDLDPAQRSEVRHDVVAVGHPHLHDGSGDHAIAGSKSFLHGIEQSRRRR